MCSVSLVVIGKNDFTNLVSIYTERYIKDLERVFTELIYVDSLSDDGSVSLMKDRGFVVYQLNVNSYKSAAAGRWVGVEQANADFILFLDSDMCLKGLELLHSEVLRAEKLGFCGFVGDVEDIYPNGVSRTRFRRINDITQEALSFGGFVLINKKVLKGAGNWDPYIPANEELELYARLKAYGFSILKTDKLKVLHYTVVTSSLIELLAVYFPLRLSRYGAFGYALRSAAKRKSLISLIKLSPEPFYFLIAMLVSIALYMNNLSLYVVLVLVIYIALVVQKRSLKYCIVPPGIALSFLVGVTKYNETLVSYDKK